MNRLLCFALAGLLFVSPAWANFDVTIGSGTHVFAIDAANQGTSLCAATSTECPASVLVDTAGAPFGTTGNHLFATVTGTFWQTTQPVSIATAPALVASSAIIGKVGIDQTTPGTTNGVFVTNTLTALVNSADSIAPVSTVTSSAGNSPVNGYNFIFDGTNWDRARGTAGGVTLFAPQAAAAGAALNAGPFYSAASNNATNVKGSAGTLYSVTVTQSTTTAMELKLYNSSTSPTCSSATGIIDNIPIPSNATAPGYHLTFPVGRAFSTGISFCLVAFGAPAASTDNGNAVTGATVSMTYD